MDNQKHNLEAVRELLPWYVNGSLTPDESATVEQALVANDDLKSELADLQKLTTEIVTDMPTIPDAAVSFQKLQARIHATSVPKPAPKPTLTQWLQTVRDKLLWIPVPAQAFAAIAMIAMLGFVVLYDKQPNNTFIALSDPAIEHSFDSENSIIVTFNETPNRDTSKTLAEQVGASAISGPNTVGAYQIYFSNPQERDQALLELRKNPALQLIESIQNTDI